MSSSPKVYDRVLATSTTTGTGTYTLGSAVTGYQAWAVLGDGNSAYYCAEDVDGNGVPSGGWEGGIGTYTTAGTTLTRDLVLFSSNAGAAVNWSAGTRRIFLTDPAVVALPVIGDMGGRLTTESGAGVSTANRTAQGTIYDTPFKHNRVQLWDGSGWRRYTFAEISLALTVTSGKNYDTFMYDNAGTLTLELSAAWTDDTTRADAVALQDGILVKSGAPTRRLRGTIRASGTNVIEDSLTNRFVWNCDNQIGQALDVISVSSHTYGTATERDWNNNTSTQVSWVTGRPGRYSAFASSRLGGSDFNSGIYLRVNGTTFPEAGQLGASGITRLDALVTTGASGYERLGLNTALVRENAFGGFTTDFSDGHTHVSVTG